MTDAPLTFGIPARAVLALILACGFCVRVATFHSPLLDQHAWRQADTAGISRAFAEERYNILYPQVEWRGAAATGYVETGLELHAFVVASLAKLSGVGFRPEFGRLLSAVYFLFSCTLVWVFTRRRYGSGTGLLAAYLYAFGFPLMLFMERAFMNEALLVCLSLTSLVAAQRYLDVATDAGAGRAGRRRWVPLTVLCVTTAVVGAVKLPYLIVLAPIVGLFIERYGRGVFARPEPYVVSLFAIGVSALWYRHAHALGVQSGLSFGTLDKVFSTDVALSWHLYRMVALRTFRDIIGPIGLLGIGTGTWLAWRHRRWCELLALAGFLAYVILVAGGNVRHNYYQLAMMPLAATLSAVGLLHVIDRVPRFRKAYATSVTTLLILVALATTIRSASFHSWYEIATDDAELCAVLPEHFASPSERIVLVGSNDPRFLFCLNRKGWLLDNTAASEIELRRAWEQGARVALVFPDYVDAVQPWLREHAVEISVPGHVRAYTLKPR